MTIENWVQNEVVKFRKEAFNYSTAQRREMYAKLISDLYNYYQTRKKKFLKKNNTMNVLSPIACIPSSKCNFFKQFY